VLHEGFEDTMRAGLDVLRDAQRISVFTSGRTIEEFGPPLFDMARGVMGRGGPVRVLAAHGLDPEVAAELGALGAEVRVLDEPREVGLMVSDRAVVLAPVDLGPHDPLPACAVSLRTLVAVARFQLLFDHAWERGKPALQAQGNKSRTPRGK
jgi:hypothetical protein